MNESIRYQIIRSRQRKRTLALFIERNGTVVVRVPMRVTREEVDRFVKEKERWIRRKVIQVRERQEHLKSKGFVPGEEFFYLGRPYTLKITPDENGQCPLVFRDDLFLLRADCREKAQDVFIRWYREQAETIIRQRILHYQDRVQVHPRGERITSAKYQWGGCSARNTLTFAWRLMMAPLPVIDYVIVHELAHIREKNHSPRFWKIVEQHLPDYRARRKWLRDNGHLLNL
jgi:predicted metal-dependent hydrolase